MADPLNNLKQGFSDPRTRLIVVFLGGLGIIALIFGVSSLRKTKTATDDSSARLQIVKGVSSIPGDPNQTEEYAKLQREQNVEQAQKAIKKGTSAIPTIVGSDLFSSGKAIEKIDGAKQGVGFTALTRLQQTNTDLSWLGDLKSNSCNADSIRRAIGQGATLKQLKDAGCPVKNLCGIGYRLADMVSAGFTAKDLRDCGYSAKDLKGAGYSWADLRKAGFSACDLKALGATVEDLAKAGFSAGELKGAGFDEVAIRNAEGIPDSFSQSDLNKITCTPEGVRAAKARGLSAGAIRRIAGCTASQLRNGGFSLKDLKEAGFSAAALRKAGFSAAELKAAGFSTAELRKAGFSAADLRAAGFSPEELAHAGFTVCDLKSIGINAKTQRAAGATARELMAGGFSETELLAAGFSQGDIQKEQPTQAAMQALMTGGCSTASLKQARANGIVASLIKRQLNCTAKAFKSAGYTAGELRRACFSAKELKDAGFSAADLKAAGFTAAELKDAGFSAKELANAGFSAAELAAAGFSAKELRAAGFSAAELKDAGFSAAELAAAGFSASDLRAAGFSAAELKAAGFSAADLKAAGFSAAELKAAGFSAKDLLAAGYSAKDLKDAGFSAKDLLDAGVSLKDLKAGGFSAEELKKAGLPLKDVLAAGYSAKDLKDAGFTTDDLMKSGVSGCDLKEAGATARDIVKSDPTPEQLKNSCFSPRALVDGGANTRDLLKAGFNVQQLKRAGISGGQLKRAADDVLAEADSGELNLTKDQLAQLNAMANGLLGEQSPQDDKLEQFIQLQSKQFDERAKAKDLRDSLNNMERYARQVLKDGKSPQQSVQAAKEEKGDKGDKAGSKNQTSQSTVIDPGYENNDISVVDYEVHYTRSGDVTFAVLDTAVNTDEPGPVMATIVSGVFRGAKIMGTIGSTSQDTQKVALNFNSMTLPGAKSSVSIAGLAIDPSTARTALSSNTNNHVLLRYGSLFASSFMTGYAQAISERGTTVTTDSSGSTSVTSTPLNGREQVLVGFGEVGTAWATQVKKNFNRKPTIQIYSGTNMAILFTQDFAVKLPLREDF